MRLVFRWSPWPLLVPVLAIIGVLPGNGGIAYGGAFANPSGLGATVIPAHQNQSVLCGRDRQSPGCVRNPEGGAGAAHAAASGAETSPRVWDFP